uniref:hypothetical protein n=1 Tax=Prevotella sp. TaxID=59823 RepID=UPI004028E437
HRERIFMRFSFLADTNNFYQKLISRMVARDEPLLSIGFKSKDDIQSPSCCFFLLIIPKEVNQ